MQKVKVVFMGTPEFAVPVLEGLIENTNVVLVVSQPDKEVGRHKIMTSSPVKVKAIEHNIEVFTPKNIKEDYEQILKVEPDMIVTCAYGQIIPEHLLTLPSLGCINVHASLLPKYRGGAPIHRAIMAGDNKTGITVMYMDSKMDSGDIIKKFEIPILEEDNLETLSQKLSNLGAKSLIECLPSIISKTCSQEKQNENEVTYANIIKKEDEMLNFDSTTKEVFDHIRALNPNPGAFFLLNGKKIKVYNSRIGKTTGQISVINNIYKDGIGIGTKDGEIILTEIKPEGKNRVAVRDYLNGKDVNKLKGMKLNDKMD